MKFHSSAVFMVLSLTIITGATPLFAAIVVTEGTFNGTLYSMRYGQQEPVTQDMVNPPHYIYHLDTGQQESRPACGKINTPLSFDFQLGRTNNEQGEIGYKCSVIGLMGSHVFPPDPNDPPLVYPDHASLTFPDPLPNFVKVGNITFTWTFFLRQGSGQGQWGPPVNTYLHIQSMHVVLDTPKDPMVPVWVNVVSQACQWLEPSHVSEPEAAAAELTDTVYEHCTYFSANTTVWTLWPFSDQGDTFRIRGFLEGGTYCPGQPPIPPLKGQCSDFSEFLVSCMAAVGIDGALSQRSYHIAQIYGTPPTRFYTNPANPAGPDPTRQYDWKYHQWTILPTPVYDGSLAFGAGTSPPKNMERPAYETALKAPPPFPPLPPGQVWNPLAFDPVQFCPNVVAYK